MTTNRLAKSQAPGLVVPSDPQERKRFWIERGNRVLWGQEITTKKGDFLPSRFDLEWVCRNGSYSIQTRRDAEVLRELEAKHATG